MHRLSWVGFDLPREAAGHIDYVLTRASQGHLQLHTLEEDAMQT